MLYKALKHQTSPLCGDSTPHAYVPGEWTPEGKWWLTVNPVNWINKDSTVYVAEALGKPETGWEEDERIFTRIRIVREAGEAEAKADPNVRAALTYLALVNGRPRPEWGSTDEELITLLHWYMLHDLDAHGVVMDWPWLPKART